MELFDVRIQRFDAKRNTRICGIVGDSVRERFFYNRPITNPESVHLGHSPLLLTGPKEPYAADDDDDPFGIEIDIKDAGTGREIIKGSLPRSEPGYNRFIREELVGTNGSALISYAVFDKAVSATVEIVLINGADDVYGVVAASNTVMWQGQSVLFHRKKEEKNASVRPGGQVPLSRCVMALPVDSDLDVFVDLWDCGCEIASASFRHCNGRLSTKIISRQIKVVVTWTARSVLK